MIKKILTLISFIWLSGCSGATFEKGLNYEKTPEYRFDYDKGTHGTNVTNNKNESNINIMFGRGSCGFFGLIGPLIFPIIPFWQNHDCKDVVIGIGETKKFYIIYQNKVYEPSKIVKGGGYFFPLQTKSITDTATLVVEKKDGEKFEIPFRYQHTFSFDLWPGR
jgi:hypothetical protein